MPNAKELHVTAAGAYQHVLEELIPIFEQQRDVFAQMNGAIAFVRQHARPEVFALLRIRLERQQAVPRDHRHRARFSRDPGPDTTA